MSIGLDIACAILVASTALDHQRLLLPTLDTLLQPCFKCLGSSRPCLQNSPTHSASALCDLALSCNEPVCGIGICFGAGAGNRTGELGQWPTLCIRFEELSTID